MNESAEDQRVALSFENDIYIYIYTLGTVGRFRKWSCENLKIKKYLRQNEYIGIMQTVA